MSSLKKIGAVASVSILEMLRRRDMYVALILALVIIIPLSSVNLFGVEGVVRYVREVTLLLIWVCSIVIAISTTSRQVPGELQRRTILPLLAKPIRRGEFVVGKFVGSTLATSIAIFLFYACYIILVGVKSGIWLNLTMIQAMFLHLLFITLVCAMTLCGSLIFTASANVTICALVTIGMLLFGGRLSEFAMKAPAPANFAIWTTHFLFPHFEFFDSRLRMVHEWGPHSLTVFLAATFYAVLYTLALVTVAMLVFRRKRL